jgi:RNA polymerase sigma factor (sigma-70 family)
MTPFVNKKYSDDEIVAGIRTSDKKVIASIYTDYYPSIEYIIVRRLKGSSEMSQDIFQDALEVIFTTIVSDLSFRFTYSFAAYLRTICVRLFIKKVGKNKAEQHNFNDIPLVDHEPGVLEMLIRDDKVKLFEQHFLELGELCREILTFVLEGYSNKEITKILQLSSDRFTANRRLKCKESLFAKIYSDPKFKELKNGKPGTIREIPEW